MLIWISLCVYVISAVTALTLYALDVVARIGSHGAFINETRDTRIEISWFDNSISNQNTMDHHIDENESFHSIISKKQIDY